METSCISVNQNFSIKHCSKKLSLLNTHTTIRVVKIKRVIIASVDEDVELLALLDTTGRDVK